ncbi:MAG: alpha/beta hydrolase [Pseudomonadota bacterium]|nr:alpha/beta hydrolase [Pseudomonadota bacterium]
MRPLRHFIAASVLAITTLITTGCESLLFRFANRGLAAPEASVTYAPDLGLALDVYRPQQVSDQPAPTVVFFYGGGWQRGTRQQYQFVGRRLAQNGVLAIVADYRTYPATTFPGFVEDAAHAVAWSHRNAARYGGDPGKLFVAGHSAGAQIAALLGTDPRYLAAHGLEPSVLAGVVGLSGPYDFEITGRYQPVFGPQAQWSQAQAINYVDGQEPPFLLIHGAQDRVVEARDSRQLSALLRQEGGSARLLLLPEGGHSAPLMGLYDPDREADVLPAILAFLRGEPPPA